MNVSTTVIAMSGVLGGGGLVAIVNALAGRRVSKADAAGRLSDGALRWVEQFQESALAAEADARLARTEAAASRSEAAACRAEVSELRGQLVAVRDEAHRIATELRVEARQLADDLYQVHRALRDPTMTIERLRAIVGKPPNDPRGKRSNEPRGSKG